VVSRGLSRALLPCLSLFRAGDMRAYEMKKPCTHPHTHERNPTAQHP
jgi:hypothetical protein